MSTTIAYNSILVSSLQEDKDLTLSFEQASWFSEFQIKYMGALKARDALKNRIVIGQCFNFTSSEEISAKNSVHLIHNLFKQSCLF